MPEIPEVEAFKDYIKKTCLNKKISDVKSKDKSLIKGIVFKDFKNTLIDKKFKSAERKGKYLIINLTHSQKKLVMHFGLTGSLAYKKSADIPVKFSKVTFIFADNSALHWINKRKFGKVWLIGSLDQIEGLARLGPDATKISEKQFEKLLKNSAQQNIKALLMDQEKISGIGNEYSDEILYQAGIDPHHKAGDLSESKIKKMYKKMNEVLDYSTKLREKNLKDLDQTVYFSDVDRKSFKSSYLQAHRHIDDKCPKNNNHKLKTAKIAGRTSYYCPKEQK
jgi:formamidopyrimidine-DNA glycosylase